MSARFWFVADRVSHKIPWFHFGLIRHHICIKYLETNFPEEKWR